MKENQNSEILKNDKNFDGLQKESEINLAKSNQEIIQISPEKISEKFINKYNNEELNKFKDEILSFFKEREDYLISKISSYQSQIESSEKKYEHLTKIVKLNYQEILSSQANINNRLDKFNTYEQFVLKTNDNLTSHEIRINNLREDFSKATQKYDKIYLDNLELPGFIGRCAKYKNCQLFFADIIKELNKLNNYKEKNSIDLKAYKEKLEQMIKTFKSMLDNNNEAQIKYINKSNEKNINECKHMVDILGERVIELRLENSKYSVELINKTNEIKENMNKIKEMKNELLNDFYNKIDEYKNITNNINKSFNEFKNEYSVIRKKFLELAEFIKDIRFKKNLGGDVDKKDINNLYKNLIKKTKKSSKDKNVQLLSDISNIEKMEFKVNTSSNNNNNLNNNNNTNNNNNEKFIRGNKRHETYNSSNKIINMIRDNYFGLNNNVKKEDKESNRNNNSKQNNDNMPNHKTSDLNHINLKENENKENNIKDKKVNDNKLIKNDNLNEKSNDNSNNLFIKDKIKVRNIKENIDLKNININENKDNKKSINNEKSILNLTKNENGDIIVSKKEGICCDIKKEPENNMKDNIIVNDHKNSAQNKNAEIEALNLENKDKKGKRKIKSNVADNSSISESFSSFCNNNTIAGTGTISDRNISSISIPISYNINNVKCNKFILNDMCQDENDNKIIKELASELEQSTAKKIKNLGSQKKIEEENFQKKIIQNIEPINLINNIQKNEIIKNINSDKNNFNKTQSLKNMISDGKNGNIENIENSKNDIFSEGEKSPKININKLLNNNKLKLLINQEIESDNININSDTNEINNNNKYEKGFSLISNNNSEFNNETSYNNNLNNDNSPSSINKKLFLFNKKLFNIEKFMKDKFIEIIYQIDYLKQINSQHNNNYQIKPYKTNSFRTDQNVFNTINNDNASNYTFSLNGKEDNYCNINYHTIKSPRFNNVYSQLFSSGGKKSFKKYNYFKDSVLSDNLSQNNKNEEISAIKQFIEKKININNSKTFYKDLYKKNLKGFVTKKHHSNFNSMNKDFENNEILSKTKNNSTINGNDMKWVDLKVLINNKMPKNSSCQKLNPILSGENN